MARTKGIDVDKKLAALMYRQPQDFIAIRRSKIDFKHIKRYF